MAEPLHQLMKKRAEYQWTSEQQKSSENLKTSLVNSVILSYPNPKDTFILDMDASDASIGAELTQIQEGQEKIISFGSKVLTPAQHKYCTTRKELLAIVMFTRQYRHYLLRKPFIIRTDHNSLTWLMNFKNIEGQLARWLEELSQYDIIIQHRSEKDIKMLMHFQDYQMKLTIVSITGLVWM